MQARYGADSSRATDTVSAPGRGWPWWAAAGLAVSVTAVGAVADVRIDPGLGAIFQVSFAVGCVVAVLLARRGELFGPMLQPPLILACVTLPVMLLWDPSAERGTLLSRVIAAGLPMVDNFPLAAGTTMVTVVIGIARMIMHRKPADSANSEIRKKTPHTSHWAA